MAARIACVLALASLIACGESSSSRSPSPEPSLGDTRFVSAEPDSSQAPWRGGGSPSPSDDLENGGGTGGEGPPRTVEEGDIYRMLDGGLLLNLSPYRGLQVIDLSDTGAPRIVSRLEIGGSPVEMYVSGDRALVLLNDWVGYAGSRHAAAVTREEGGVVLSVDLREPAAPRVIDRQVVPGWISRSRLAKGGRQESLYVVSQQWGMTLLPDGRSEWSTTTVVQSIHVADGVLTPQTRLDLGGWIADIQATPEALLVARTDWSSGRTSSLVSVVDISREDGVMVEGDEVEVPGLVSKQFQMDLYRGILRVVSGSSWGGTTVNTLQTFDATDPLHLVPIDTQTFGAGESLFATLFLGNSAFFVTYERQDPFHAFQITDEGIATEKSQFIVSGWNDFFRPVLGGTRLVGIGVDDANGRKLAVSLYDVTDLENPTPLVQRAQIDLDWGWSEANWDHRAFSVIDDAVSASGPDGSVETGLVLLPYSGWDPSQQTAVVGVRIFTFGASSITARGTMVHGTPVRRSFAAAPHTAVNLSDAELRLFSTAQPDDPVELSKLDLAPNYGDVLFFGEWGVRQRSSSDPWWYYRGSRLPDRAEIVPPGASLDSGPAAATIEVPLGAMLRKVGDRLVAISSKVVDGTGWPAAVETTISSFDLSDPAHPAPLGSLVTQAIPAAGGGWWDYEDCFDCGGFRGYGAYSSEVLEVGPDSLAFVQRTPRQRNLGTGTTCEQYPTRTNSCWGTTGPCSEYDGYRSCTTLRGATTCAGVFYSCDWMDGARTSCEPVDPTTVAYQEYCHTHAITRHWSSFEVHAVEVPASGPPRLGDTATLPEHEEAVGVVPADGGLWLSVKIPYTISGDTRPYAQHFVRRLDVEGRRIDTGRRVNVPGPLLEASGSTLYTLHRLWSRARVDTAVARARLSGDEAVLDGYRAFTGEVVDAVRLDGAGHALVVRDGWNFLGAPTRLAILDATSESFRTISDVEVDDWAYLSDARAGRALFEVRGGLLVFNLDSPANPVPQAYFPLYGWPQTVRIDGKRLVVPAGPYGIYELDLDRSNL